MKKTKNYLKCSVILVSLVLLNIFSLSFVSAGEGSGAVPITTIELTGQGNDYSMKPGRLKFEFDGNSYAIQLRRVKQQNAEFLVMTLDMDRPDDITAYTLDDSFNLTPGEKKEIDINKDGTKDMSIELNNIISTETSIGSADFSIKKINTEKSETIITDEPENVRVNNTEVIGFNNINEGKVEVQESVSAPVIILNQETQEQPTFLRKIINFFRNYFKQK